MKQESTGFIKKTYTNAYSYMDCLKKEISYFNQFLLDFFKKLDDEYQAVINKKNKELVFKSSTYINNAEHLENKRAELIEILKDKLTITCISIPKPIRANDNASMFIKVNNCFVLFDYFINEDFDAYANAQSLVKKLDVQRNNLEHSIEDFKALLKVKQNIMKISIFNRNQKKEEILGLKDDLDQKVQMHDKLIKEIETYKLIDSLPNSEKAIFIKILKYSIQAFELRRKAFELEETANCMMNQVKYDKKILKEIFDKEISEGKITEEMLQKVFLQFDKVEIKARRSEYSFRRYYGEKERFAKKIESMLEWFISDIYEADDDFAKRNINIENSYQKIKK